MGNISPSANSGRTRSKITPHGKKSPSPKRRNGWGHIWITAFDRRGARRLTKENGFQDSSSIKLHRRSGATWLLTTPLYHGLRKPRLFLRSESDSLASSHCYLNRELGLVVGESVGA